MSSKPMDVAIAIELIYLAAEYAGSTFANTESAFNALVWSDERPKPTWAELQEAWLNSAWATYSTDDFSNEEIWRAIEMPFAQECITAIDFGDDTIPGTEAQWKAYWIALRNWKEGNPNYPDIIKRPPRPS